MSIQICLDQGGGGEVNGYPGAVRNDVRFKVALDGRNDAMIKFSIQCMAIDYREDITRDKSFHQHL